MFLTMPRVFTYAEYVDMVFCYGVCNGNALAACRKYSLRFPNSRVSHLRVFASVYNKLPETGALPSIHISSERANEQNVDEVESILQSVERSPTTITRRISTNIVVSHRAGLCPWDNRGKANSWRPPHANT
jgi:hypothetical protein